VEAAFVTFSDVTGKQNVSRGELLAQAIQKFLEQDDGSFVRTNRVINPKTGNDIIVWLWTVNHDAFRGWYTEAAANRIE
jgi:hypothetical protein